MTTTWSASTGPCQRIVSRPAHRVDLEVTEIGREDDLLARQRLEQLERRPRAGRVVAGSAHTRVRRSSRVRRCSSSPAANSAAEKSVAPASAIRADPRCDGRLVADDRDVGRTFRTLAVEHGAVAREEAVHRVDLRGTLRARRRRRRSRRPAGRRRPCGAGRPASAAAAVIVGHGVLGERGRSGHPRDGAVGHACPRASASADRARRRRRPARRRPRWRASRWSTASHR